MSQPNVARDSLFPSVPKEQFHDYVEGLLATPPGTWGSLHSQMELLAQICTTDTFLQKVYQPSEEQATKDRYLNVHPSVDYRVRLDIVDDDPGSDYINACWFQSTLPGCSARYIASQAPVPESFDDFWRMVWENDVCAIVMLTCFVERDRNGNERYKADMYWEEDGKRIAEFGDIKVTLTSFDERTHLNIHVREFSISRGSETRKLTHFQYLGWPDHGAPQPDQYPEIVNLLGLYREVRAKRPDSPIIFHCSAGIGRNGTMQTIDSIVDNLSSKNPAPINVFNAVLELRVARPGSVQTTTQYEFIFRFIDFCIQNGHFGIVK